MKNIFIATVATILLLSSIVLTTSCTPDPLEELLDELEDSRRYRIEVSIFGTVAGGSVVTVHDGDRIMTSGMRDDVTYLEKIDEKYYVYAKNAQGDMTRFLFEGKESDLFIDETYLDFDSYTEADEEPGTYKLKDGIELKGIKVSEVRASLRDGVLTLTIPQESGYISRVVIDMVGKAVVKIPEVK